LSGCFVNSEGSIKKIAKKKLRDLIIISLPKKFKYKSQMN